MLTRTSFTAFNLSEAWYRALWYLFHEKNCREYMVQHGSFENQHMRRELDFLSIHILNPGDENGFVPIIPEGINITPPTDREQIENYFAKYILGSEKAENEDYTYGQRINMSLNHVVKMLKETPNTNQAIIEIGKPSDIELADPPCLRLCQFRIKDNTLHLFIYFRSWDIYQGLPVNLGGLQLLKYFMADEIGVEDGQIIVDSIGAHVYDYNWDNAKELVRCNG